MEERLIYRLINSAENSNQHTDMLIEEEKTEQQVELLPRREEAPRPYVSYFKNWFVNVDFVADVEEDLMQEEEATEEKSMKLQKLEESNNNLKTREREYVYQTKDVWRLLRTFIIHVR